MVAVAALKGLLRGWCIGGHVDLLEEMVRRWGVRRWSRGGGGLE